MEPKLTYHAACVLQALAKGAGYGFDVMDLTGLASGTVYPILRRFEEAGWVRSEWEDTDPHREGRPRRRQYYLADQGTAALALAAERYAMHARLFEQPTSTVPRRT